ncbi:VanZ family protein [Caproicibacterium lactatifermentans]|nr:VanZ family protein [Caproicibacterium lactatifermentans]
MAVCCMILIFHFSAQNGPKSDSVSMPCAVWLKKTLRLSASNVSVHHFIRKAAHFTIYMLLAAFTAGWLSSFSLRPAVWLFVTVAFCAAYAVGDEFHQSFTALRSPSPWDVLLDTIGAAIGAVLILILTSCCRKGRKKAQL